MILRIISLLCLFCATVSAWPDPKIRTRGQIWPQPQNVQYLHAVRQAAKKVVVTKSIDCDILDKALKRYEKILGLTFGMASSRSRLSESLNEDPLTSLHVDVAETECPGYPNLGVDESYTLDANTTNVYIKAKQVWGALRGLESFSQLFFYTGNDQFFQTAIVSNDYPRFPHRGLLLDTSRHFYSIKVIKAIIELMAMNKMNVFHWHIVDMEAFPYVSKVYPEFSQGAYDSNHTYTSAQVKEIIDFARLHGIRVLPELDTPGHVASWGRALSFMTSRCFDQTGKEMSNLDRGMLDVSNKKMWSALVALFKELMNLFPDKYFHLGGDETSYWMQNCWMNNENITTFMKSWDLKTAIDLEQWYFDQLFMHFSLRDMPKKKFIVWQEVVNMGIKLPKGVVAHIWTGNRAELAKNLTSQGFYTILSECWYLDHISWDIDYQSYYKCDPQDFDGSDAQKRMVLGGEAAMWGEMVDATNAIQRIFPRTSAVAEKLWSNGEFTKQDPELIWPRLSEMQCRMIRRGYPAQPGYGPGYCEVEYEPNLPNWD